MSINISKQTKNEMKVFLKKLKDKMTDDESIIKLNEIENAIMEKKYGLVWEEHEENVDVQLKEKIPVFKEVSEKELIVEGDYPYNFLLNGDNLHSLYLLEKTHRDSVFAIYIDPPYNTESKDFKYNDDYVDSQDGYSHSKWISFMEKRLRIARRLLRNDGCIMISINENELFVLKLLMDDIFGEDNYLTTISVKVRHEDRILKGDKDFHEVVEYLLFYRKSPEFQVGKRKEDNTNFDEYRFKIIEKTDEPEERFYDGKKVHVFKPSEYEIQTIEPNKEGLKKINIRGSIKEGNSSGRFFMSHFENLMENEDGYLYKVFDMGADSLGFRYFRNPLKKENRVNGDYFQGLPVNRKSVKYIPYPNLVDFEAEFNNVGYEGGVEFRNGKKPVEFIKFLLKLAGVYEEKNAIVLDFFAGSGSTLEAVHQINTEDNGNRVTILATNNDVGPKLEEKFRKDHKMTPKEFKEFLKKPSKKWLEFEDKHGICNSITYKRAENIFKGYEIRRGRSVTKVEGIPFNLMYYKTDYISRHISDDVYISDKLLNHVKEMIQLQYHIKIDDIKYIILYNDSDLEKIIGSKRINECKKVFKPSFVFLNTEQEKMFQKNNVDIITIPEYYFANELRSVGEL